MLSNRKSVIMTLVYFSRSSEGVKGHLSKAVKVFDV